MSYLNNYFGLLGCLMLIIALPLAHFKQPGYSRKTITIVIFLVMGLSVLPVSDLTILAYIRAILGDLSITSMIMLCFMIATAYSGQQYFPSYDRQQLYNYVLVGAVILYPAGLGIGFYDTYALGFGSLLLLSLLILLAACLVWRQVFYTLTLLLLAVIGYLVNILPSDNLWDYLLDPWLVMLVFVIKSRQLFASFRRNTRVSSH